MTRRGLPRRDSRDCGGPLAPPVDGRALHRAACPRRFFPTRRPATVLPP